MFIEVGEPETSHVTEQSLENDARWLLVQRILKTETFQRAEQLRKILTYVSRAAILHPDQVLREYDIAFNALGRRQSFDPAQDNIVRVQFKNLRQRLERYFLEEGRNEPIAVSIPKGSYLPIFAPGTSPATAVASEPQLELKAAAPADAVPASAVPKVSTEPITAPRPGTARAVMSPWLVLALIVVSLSGWAWLGVNALRSSVGPSQNTRSKGINPAFLQFLSRFQGVVPVVVPDTSEMMIQMITGAEITAEDYARRDFPEKQIASVKDPEVRDVLTKLSLRRNTAAGEAKIAVDLIEALRQAGVASTFRYARDLHVRDFDRQNTILMGSRNSDPWLTLFADQMNFRFTYDPASGKQYFLNVSPRPGEQSQYALYLADKDEHENYAHIAFIPNVHKNGSMLFIEGSDAESAEAAANLLLYGQLTPQIEALLRTKDIEYFEIFLRGRHLPGESDDSLQILSVRTSQ